jgi:purine-nucleoside phosphorylase
MTCPDLRLARRGDIPLLMGVERTCFPDPWDEEVFRECVRPATAVRTWMATSQGRVIGYTCASVPAGGILHIANLCVVKSWRRRGVGRFLIGTVEHWGRRLGARYGFLEVRNTNRAALSLYGARGYLPCEELPDYYGPRRNGMRLVRRLPVTREDHVRAALSSAISARIGEAPPVGVVLGSGLSWIADSFGTGASLSVEGLPGMSGGPVVAGHPGGLAVSTCGRFVFLLGRRHHYQGYSGDDITMLVTALADLGTRCWVLTCSAGAVARDLAVGDAVVMSDHINLSGCVPSAVGRTGEGVYSARLRGIALECAARTRRGVREGLFACVSGPAYETPAELRLLSRMGVDAVSMSTAQEALALSSSGCDVLGLALVSNDSSPGAPVTHEDVLAAQETIRKRRGAFLRLLLKRVASDELR